MKSKFIIEIEAPDEAGCETFAQHLMTKNFFVTRVTSTEQIQKRIYEILADERLSYPTATIYANAPLALIQFELEVELHTLQKVMNIQRTDIDAMRGERKNKKA
jgi:hypothetical protein